MKLRKGIYVTFGHRAWKDEIPDRVLAEVTKDWPEEKIAEFKRLHGLKKKKKKDN